VVLMSPAGKRFTQAEARRLAGVGHVVVLCGRYEGIDERVRERWATDESVDRRLRAVGRRVAGAGGCRRGGAARPGRGRRRAVGGRRFVYERGLLDYPHYTRPADFRGTAVPEVLLSGHHGEIRRWRRREALRRTLERRPDLLETAELDDDERACCASGKPRARAGRRRRESGHDRDGDHGEGAADRAAADEAGRHGARARAREGRRQGTHPDLRGCDHQPAPGGIRASFTVRKVSFGQGVERIFPMHSPIIQKVDVVRSAKVRRAKLYFLRDLKGKAARMKEVKKKAN
jgi:hypothetical protein